MTRRRANFLMGACIFMRRLYEAGLFAPLENKWIIKVQSTFLVGESSTMKNNDPIFISIGGCGTSSKKRGSAR